MTDILPPWPLLTAFLVASLVLAVTPGPGVLYIVTRSVWQGPRSGLASMAGVALGNFANAVGAAIGLAALLAVSSTAFMIVKYAGAVYLFYLGIKAFRSPASARGPGCADAARIFAVFRDGFMVALFNPKTALFFAAFLPQFMAPHAEPILQSIALGGLFVAIAAVTDTAYIVAAGTIATTVAGAVKFRRFGRFAVGGTFVGLGLVAAVGGPRSGN